METGHSLEGTPRLVEHSAAGLQEDYKTKRSRDRSLEKRAQHPSLLVRFVWYTVHCGVADSKRCTLLWRFWHRWGF